MVPSAPMIPQLGSLNLPERASIRRSTIVVQNVGEYMEDIKIYTQQNEESYCEKYFNLETVTSLLVLTASTYNIVFVPLSFGFRIKF